MRKLVPAFFAPLHNSLALPDGGSGGSIEMKEGDVMSRIRMNQRTGTLTISEFVEDKKTGAWHPTLIDATGGNRIPNPEAIRVLRRDSKLRRYLEAWAAQIT